MPPTTIRLLRSCDANIAREPAPTREFSHDARSSGVIPHSFPTRNTKDGSFLSNMVRFGLLDRPSGAENEPLDATYSLTERDKHAADNCECDFHSDVLITLHQKQHSGG
ncbi:MAG: hypothetical protein K8U57_04325 [Planctomycetes bacterium]|nr:hypothetical protein [Planctomycetota bacterium]